MKTHLCAAAILILGSFPLLAANSSEIATLDQAVATALARGPDIKVAQLTLDAAGAQLNQAKAKNGFSLGANSGYSHVAKVPGSASTTTGSTVGVGQSTTLPGESVQGALSLSGPSTTAKLQGSYGIADNVNSDGTHDQVATLGASLSQTIYDGYPGGRASAAYKQAGYAYQLAQINFQSAKDNVIYSVEQAYYTLLGAQHTVTLREAQLKQSQEDLARTNAFFKANRVTKLDVLTSQVAEQTAQANLNSARDAVKQDRSSFAVLLGWPLDKTFSVAEVNGPAPSEISEQEAVQTALQNRSEIRQFDINRAESVVSLATAKSQARPIVAVTGSASYDIYPGATTNVNGGTWNAGVTVDLPIFDSGLVSAQAAQASENLSQIGVKEDQEKQNITIEVRKSLYAVKDASVRLELAKKSVTQAQGEYELQKTKFSAGLSSNLDVIDASVTLENAQVSLEQAKTNLNLAVLNLEKSMGTLGSGKKTGT